MMDYAQFIKQVINDGIEAARADYKEPKQKQKLDGSILGFERCRGKNPENPPEVLRHAVWGILPKNKGRCVMALRALVKADLEHRKALKRLGYLTRDSRAKERRKFGLKKARKAPQWAKR